MRVTVRGLFGIGVAAALAGCGHGASAVAPLSQLGQSPSMQMGVAAHPFPNAGVVVGNAAQVCGAVGFGQARCDAWVRIDVPTVPAGAGPDAIFGYHPADLQAAYKLPSSTGGKNQTVAVVDAYDDPNAESDLAVYRSEWGESACTTANGCFKRVNQAGQQSNYPGTDPSGRWELEESLDVDMISAGCPNCKIILVEANSNSFLNLAKSVDTAVKLGANAVSNSYGGGEGGFLNVNKHYNHPGHMVTASNGDSGYGPQCPACSQYLTAVGGTTLTKSSNKRGWAETVWQGTGSGCSTVAPKPSWQTDTGCKMRTIGDTSADANPGTGVAFYDTFGGGGWGEVGGTSVSSPLVASVYALEGNARSLTYASRLYKAPRGSLYDVTSGSNGTCKPAYLCTGEKGYDAPTGWGTPHGDEAF